ncbi:MAG: hypothetical protein ACOC44_09955 [Promethearchaeia archaeon]
MPTIAHAILGGAIALILYTITNSTHWESEKRFNERMVVLVAFNSFIGPDIFTMFYAFNLDASVIPIRPFVHSILGWIAWSGLIMWLWYYIINYKAEDTERVSFLATFFLLVAAGEAHFFLDFLDNGVDLIGFGDLHMHLTLQDNFLLGYDYMYGPLHPIFPWVSMTELFFIGLGFMILLIYSLFNWKLIWTYMIAGIFLGTLLLLYLLFGSYIVGFENDFGIIILFGGFLLLPVSLMVAAIEL